MSFMCRNFHARISLPEEWYLEPVKSDTKFENDEPGPSGIFELFKAPFRRRELRRVRLAKSYNAVKSIIAIIQASFAITTLYRTRGKQIDQFGYAAFGLTVAPYAFMSIVNLIGNIICPEYPAAFIVENIELDRMRERIAAEGNQEEFFVEGTVGRIAKPLDRNVIDDLEDVREAATKRGKSLQHFDEIILILGSLTIMALVVGVPISIVGGLSGFQEGQSTHAQRVWTMTWLAFGIVIGTLFVFDHSIDTNSDVSALYTPVIFFIMVFYCAPAVGGFIVVGQMITQYGTCISVR